MRYIRRPPRWVLRLNRSLHCCVYRWSGGIIGKTRNGLPVLLLTTVGRRSGKPRTTPLVYLRDGERYIIAPGRIPNPDWYRNLKQTPRAVIQIGRVTRAVEAEEVESEERNQLWALAPPYWHEYQRRYPGPMPLMVLQPVA